MKNVTTSGVNHDQYNWIDRGRLVRDLTGYPFGDNDLPFRGFGLVCMRPFVTANGICATEIQWDAGYATHDSLQFAAENLGAMPAPYFLKFYNRGWFAERFDTPGAASDRMAFLQDMRVSLLQPALQAPRDPDAIPGYARQAIKSPRLIGSRLVLSEDDPDSGFPIRAVGTHTPLGKIMGVDWCLGRQFQLDERFTQTEKHVHDRYLEVSEHRRVLFDECMALIPAQGQAEAYWLRYHRVLFPVQSGDGIAIGSLLMQGETQPDRLEPFGRAGYEVPIDIS
ncbi:hypothetical protein [Anderseniella sp. Alg231-50]|uniref:hypothetical protein n=1 Tax=Anderseniella sp. Alg231-50 TaxID=1922226 RepID=UPI000D55A562